MLLWQRRYENVPHEYGLLIKMYDLLNRLNFVRLSFI